MLIIHAQSLALIDLSHGPNSILLHWGRRALSLLFLQFLSSHNLCHLPAPLLEPDDTLVQLLHLLLLCLSPHLLLSDLPMQLVNLRPEARDHRLPLLDLPGDVQDPLVILLDLPKLISLLDELFQHLVLVLDLILSEHHDVQVLALMREVGAQLLDLETVVLDPRLNRVQLPLLLDQDLIGRVAAYVKPLFPFFLLHDVRLAYETLEFLYEHYHVCLQPQILLIQIQHVLYGELVLEYRRPGHHLMHLLAMSDAMHA